MDTHIREWLALQNIVTKKFNQSFLEPLLPDTIDKCTNEETDKPCKDRNNKNCQIYTSSSTDKDSCVTKRRIKRFETTEVSPIIVGKNGKSYTLMRTVKFHKRIDNMEIYYYIFLSRSTNNIYILFPTGIVFTKDEFQNTELKYFLQNLINEILQEDLRSGEKIIICGHSMGCVLSLYTGMMIQETHKDFFDSNIIIIGSAPFKYSNDSLFTFSDLPNVKIYVFCQIDGNSASIDCYVFGGPNKFNYNPLTYFTSDDNYNGELIDDINKYSISYKYSKMCGYMHEWKNYYSALQSIYPFTPTGIVGGRSRKARRKRRRTVKKHKKPTSRK